MSRATLVALVLAPLLLLAGCGAQRTAHGAPPYQPYPRHGKTAEVRTTYPGERIRFELPRLGVEERLPIIAFIRFERALVRSERSGATDPTLKHLSDRKVSRLLVVALANRARAGVPAPGRTTVRISHLESSPTVMALQSCQSSGRIRSSARVVLGVQQHSWRIAAIRRLPSGQGC